MKNLFLKISAFLYVYCIRRIFFLFDSETIHELLTKRGEFIGRITFLKGIISFFYGQKAAILQQTYFGIRFASPVGLAAGFDYKAQLTQVLSCFGFGFGTVGTITNSEYEGNQKPRLGRLVRSRSLMVNKGFKNEGIQVVIGKLYDRTFPYPVGVSIGRTNTQQKVTLQDSIGDIIRSFSYIESSGIDFSYYELNISCPNLHTSLSFYSTENLSQLLFAVKKLKLKKPLFIKMPIDKSDKEVLRMLKIISSFPVQGVIFGNLLKDRQNAAFDPREIKKYSVGNFSGKPTEKRSNELIHIAYKYFGKNLLIIGCGGIFSAEDVYRKIKLGASLVQLITGLVFEGPQLVAQINHSLPLFLKRDGYHTLAEAVGRGV